MALESQTSSPEETSQKSRPSGWRRFMINLAIIVGALIAIRTCNQQNLASGTAIAFEGTNLKGESVSLKQYRGQPVLLHFWATWCGICSSMADNVEGVAQHYQVVTIASQSGETDQVRAYVAQHKLSFPVLADPDGRLAKMYGVNAFPTTFVIDKTGKIRHAEVGYTTEIGLRFRAFLSSY